MCAVLLLHTHIPRPRSAIPKLHRGSEAAAAHLPGQAHGKGPSAYSPRHLQDEEQAPKGVGHLHRQEHKGTQRGQGSRTIQPGCRLPVIQAATGGKEERELEGGCQGAARAQGHIRSTVPGQDPGHWREEAGAGHGPASRSRHLD